MDPTLQIHGWKRLCSDIQALRTSIDPSGALPLCANSYQDASLIAFYLPDHPKTLALNINSRPNQYALPEWRKRLTSRRALFISSVGDSCVLPSSIAAGLDSIKCAGTVQRRPDARTNIPYGVFVAEVR
jgi:hypothetical protein